MSVHVKLTYQRRINTFYRRTKGSLLKRQTTVPERAAVVSGRAVIGLEFGEPERFGSRLWLR